MWIGDDNNPMLRVCSKNPKHFCFNPGIDRKTSRSKPYLSSDYLISKMELCLGVGQNIGWYFTYITVFIVTFSYLISLRNLLIWKQCLRSSHQLDGRADPSIHKVMRVILTLRMRVVHSSSRSIHPAQSLRKFGMYVGRLSPGETM